MEPPTAEKPTSDALKAENLRLRQQLAGFEQQVVKLTEQLAAARAEIGRLKRQGKRQAAPFSRGERVAHPKKPDRKRGQGPFTRRSAPPRESYTREVHAAVGETACPDCGGSLAPDRIDPNGTDLPATAPLAVTAYHLETCRCRSCQRRVWATHPEVPPDQRGATAHRVGSRVLALAHWLHDAVGVPVRKVPPVRALALRSPRER